MQHNTTTAWLFLYNTRLQLQHAITTAHNDTIEARIRNSLDTRRQCAHLLLPLQMHRHDVIHN
eukprot:3599727-Prorocentrum_lima.AAC.1